MEKVLYKFRIFNTKLVNTLLVTYFKLYEKISSQTKGEKKFIFLKYLTITRLKMEDSLTNYKVSF